MSRLHRKLLVVTGKGGVGRSTLCAALGLAAARKALDQCHLYPDGGCTFLREKLASKWDLAPGNFVIGNGSNEVMILLAQAFLRPGDEVVFGSQAFIVYKLATMLYGATPVEVPMPGYRHDLKAMRAAVTPRTLTR